MTFLFQNLPTQARDTASEIILDSFAGGGGASTGFELALGRSPDVAINHDPEAVAMHTINHPATQHFCQSVWQVNPLEACGGRPIGAAWFSPDCKHFSKAKGGKPREKNIRDLAWIVVAYAKLPAHIRPRVIFLENVEEFQTWGPLTADGQPDPGRKGETFQQWLAELKRLGYRFEWKELRACDYGAPTIRKRLFLIARCDGLPIVWPEPTHGPGRPQPYRVAADIIDWSIPCPSIFDRERELAAATMRRIATGVMRYVVKAAEPFIVRIGHTGHGDSGKVRAADEPLSTICTKAEHLLVAPTLVQTGYGEREGQAPRALDLQKPLGTVVAGGAKHALVAAFLAKHYGGHTTPGWPCDMPISTVTTQDHHAVVAANLTHFYSSAADGGNGDLRAPLKTITAGGQHAGLVAAFLTKYYGQGGQDQGCGEPLHTIPTVDRFGLVTVELGGEAYVVTDIGMRMLTPRELFNAQGFPSDYIIDFEYRGRPLSKRSQVARCGNSVSPVMAAALIGANVPELALVREAAE